MVKILSCLLFLSTFAASAMDANFRLKDLTSENRLIVTKNISLKNTKAVTFQDGKIVKKIDPSRVRCTLENIRDEVGNIELNTKDYFKFDNNDFLRESYYVSLRIWQSHWLFGWDNGDVQVFNCDSIEKIENFNSVVLTYKLFKQAVGDYLDIK